LAHTRSTPADCCKCYRPTCKRGQELVIVYGSVEVPVCFPERLGYILIIELQVVALVELLRGGTAAMQVGPLQLAHPNTFHKHLDVCATYTNMTLQLF